jgi:Na+/H+-dicarboxylate symporter/ABC-type amino acid transport substrate-binding protein
VSLTAWVLVGGTLGIASGFFFGAACQVLSPIGFAYVMLLEAAVYPYLICSLLHGLGSLEPAKAWRLFTRGWSFYVLAWAVTFAGLGILTRAIPAVRAPAVGTATPPAQTVTGLLDLLIPNDLFSALTRNYVPAVVVFCIFYGVAVQTVGDKRPLLSVLETIRLASLRFWNWIVLLSPVGVFALFAYTTGTTALRDLVNLSVYLALFLLGTFVLAFWALPALLSALAPVGYREVLREMRAALSIAAVTTLSVAALPFITETTRKIATRCGIAESERDDVIRTNLSVAYPLGQLGNFFIYLFLVFAAYYYRTPIEPLDRVLLPAMTLLSGFGSPTSAVNAVSFLSGWLPLPSGTPGLYVEMQTITRYGQVLVSVMGFAFLSILVTLAYYGRLRVRPARLATALALPALALGGIAWAGHAVHGYLATSAAIYRTFRVDPDLVRSVGATVYRTAAAYDASPDAVPGAEAGTTTARIQATGVLRVGYNASTIPFCYFNADGALAGYDVAQAYDLARSLNVRLVFIPFEWPRLEADLRAGRFDIAMSGIYVTPHRLSTLTVSAPYYQSPLALFLPEKSAHRFRTRAEILAMRGVRIGVFDDPVLRPLVGRLLPDAEVVLVPSYATLPDFERVDAAIWTLEQAVTLARGHPGITVVVPQDLGSPFLFAYLMPPDAAEMRRFVNYWLELRRADGSDARRVAYWIHGQLPPPTEPRWSVIRDVLHWVK